MSARGSGPDGEIGRRAGFRILFRKECGFKSLSGHFAFWGFRANTEEISILLPYALSIKRWYKKIAFGFVTLGHGFV